MGEYMVSITAAAILLGILNKLSGEDTSSAKLFRLVCGIFMTLIIAQPVFDVNLTELCATARECYYIGTNASNTGVALASDALNESISDRVETYIKDKAAAYGSDLKAEVQLDENFQPRQVRIAGKISPYAKTQMQSTIEIDLGIAKENQLWINFP